MCLCQLKMSCLFALGWCVCTGLTVFAEWINWLWGSNSVWYSSSDGETSKNTVWRAKNVLGRTWIWWETEINIVVRLGVFLHIWFLWLTSQEERQRQSFQQIPQNNICLRSGYTYVLVRQKQRRAWGDIVVEPQSPCREAGQGGWMGQQNVVKCFVLPIGSQHLFILFYFIWFILTMTAVVPWP